MQLLLLPELHFHTACITFHKAKSKGMQIAVNWQDADSSSAKGVKGVKEIFKYYFIFIIHNGMWRSCREGTQTLGTVIRVSGIERGFTGDECVMFM